MRSRDPPTAGPGPTIASRVSTSQPPLALAWRCASALGGASEGRPARMQSCGQRRAATIGVIQMSPNRSWAPRWSRRPKRSLAIGNFRPLQALAATRGSTRSDVRFARSRCGGGRRDRGASATSRAGLDVARRGERVPRSL